MNVNKQFEQENITEATRGRHIQQHWCGVRREGRPRKRPSSAPKDARDPNTRVRPGAPLVADSKCNLASLHKNRRETEKARQLFLECEQIYSAVYGPDHSETQDAARQASLCV